MPPAGKLEQATLDVLARWVEQGVPWDETDGEPVPGTQDAGSGSEIDARSWWANQPLAGTPLPVVQDEGWSEATLNRFILARLEAEGLAPSPQADRLALIRRATYDLTGLPPTPEEIHAFLSDETPGAWERVIERLLASPQYGVRWGRHWLDLVRYAETDGYERDRPKPGAWRYRDWVVQAFNDDMPYDRFLVTQLAGDEMEGADFSSHVATGYFHLGIRDDEPTDTLQAQFDDLDGIVDTTCRVMLGVSMGCARCHDHKGDPLPQSDYYRFLSFFRGIKPYKVGGGNGITTENFARRIPTDLGTGVFEEQLAAWEDAHATLREEILALLADTRVASGPEVFIAAEGMMQEGLVRDMPLDTPAAINGDARGITLVAGRRGGAAHFDGNTSRVLIARPVEDDFSISLWFRTEHEGAGGNRDLRWFRGTGLIDGEIPGIHDDYGISIVGDHVCAGVGRPETFIHGPPGAADGQWHHVGFTRHREGGTIRLFVDGTMVAEAVGGTQALSSPGELAIGRMLPDRHSLDGDIEDIRIYDRVLEPGDMLGLALDSVSLSACVEIVRAERDATVASKFAASVEQALTLFRPQQSMEDVLCVMESGITPPETYVCIRGNPHLEGEGVEPGIPGMIMDGAVSIQEPPPGAGTSYRRRSLAAWIVDPSNPRTSRVMANRIWQHHFGRGIVRTPNDFGAFGLPPSHPDLLDWLARAYIDGGWSTKDMHRLIMHSRTYRMSSRGESTALARDPGNDLFWRFNMRRLSAEEVRDSILQVTGILNFELGGPSIYPPMPEAGLATASRPDQAWGASGAEDAARRSLYIYVKRSLIMPILSSFDLADTDASCPVRFNTTQPTQALTMLNSTFTNGQAAHLADRLLREAGDDASAQVHRALLLVTGRSPGNSEVREGVALMDELQQEDGLTRDRALEVFCLVAINLNEFLYLD